ncbi:hypothetical protein [Kitasatospora sp. NPDC091276]|uniref:hypothetical protein n=1 Tax=unclassified Kitasatospora TaxID=2633591 RepID=UPI00342CF48C
MDLDAVRVDGDNFDQLPWWERAGGTGTTSARCRQDPTPLQPLRMWSVMTYPGTIGEPEQVQIPSLTGSWNGHTLRGGGVHDMC